MGAASRRAKHSGSEAGATLIENEDEDDCYTDAMPCTRRQAES